MSKKKSQLDILIEESEQRIRMEQAVLDRLKAAKQQQPVRTRKPKAPKEQPAS